MAKKTIELLPGLTAEFNDQLLDDADFVTDLSNARKDEDYAEMITMYFAMIGGKDTYKKVRDHIEKEKGYFSQKELNKVLEVIIELFPKDGNRAQRRSWKDSAK